MTDALSLTPIENENMDRHTQLTALTSIMVQKCIELHCQLSDTIELAKYLSNQPYCNAHTRKEASQSNIQNVGIICDVPLAQAMERIHELDLDDLPIDKLFDRMKNLPEPDDLQLLQLIANDVSTYGLKSQENKTTHGRMVNVVGLPCSGKTTLLRDFRMQFGINPIMLIEEARSHEDICKYLRATITEEFTAAMIVARQPFTIIDGGIWHRIISIPVYLGFDTSNPTDRSIIENYLQIVIQAIPVIPEILLVEMDHELREQQLAVLTGDDATRREYALERETNLLELYKLLMENSQQINVQIYTFKITQVENQEEAIAKLIHQLNPGNTPPIGNTIRKILERFSRNYLSTC